MVLMINQMYWINFFIFLHIPASSIMDTHQSQIAEIPTEGRGRGGGRVASDTHSRETILSKCFGLFCYLLKSNLL